MPARSQCSLGRVLMQLLVGSIVGEAVASGESMLAGSEGEPFDISGLQDSLQEGGASALISALSRMRMTSGHHSRYPITYDAEGHAMYDFRPQTEPPTPAPPPPALPVKPALPIKVVTPPETPKRTSLRATTQAIVPTPQPGDASGNSPSDHGSVLLQGSQGKQIRALWNGLNAVRDSIDSLIKQSSVLVSDTGDIEMQGAQHESAATSAEFQKISGEFATMMHRLSSLEEEHKKEQEQIKTQNDRIHALETSNAKETQQLAQLVKENTEETKQLRDLLRENNELRAEMTKRPGAKQFQAQADRMLALERGQKGEMKVLTEVVKETGELRDVVNAQQSQSQS